MLSLDEIKSLVDYMSASSLSKINFKREGFSVTLERRAGSAQPVVSLAKLQKIVEDAIYAFKERKQLSVLQMQGLA
ncbi:MAG: hypothetical protein LBC09_00420 [Helicobacteraceae bacterium]|nr:hypothetical protein [Helicobacteraceae bacterium]